ncbi:MAG: asparagine synthase (glutamine-hydrolyzing) [Chloroflexota bacterium]
MCGICGWVQLQGKTDFQTSTGLFEPMNAALAHRGPDDHGAVVFDDAALGMTRLSIIDIDGGQQPITNEEENCWIVFNGEIYNFIELRDELKNRGRRFRSRSDTEVILRAYEEWGVDCVQRLRGMFAFAIYDRRKERRPRPRLFLARDRLGKKPLYYYRDGERLIFGSEIKAILAHAGVRPRVNRAVIPLYLAYGYTPSPFTFFEDIHELPPGHMLLVEDGEVAVRRYWSVPREPDSAPRLSESEYFQQVNEHFEEAVRLRLTSDVPLGAFLSGGVDSAAVVAVMTKLLGGPVSTFSIGFADDPSFDELPYARMVAERFGSDHHEFVVQPDAVELLPKLVWHYDQPFADSSAIPTYLVAQMTRAYVKVALTGDGGDELFAGYQRFAAARLAEYYRRAPRFFQNAVSRLVHAWPESTAYEDPARRMRRFVDSAALPLADRYLNWVGIFNPDMLRQLLAAAIEMDPVDHFRGYFSGQENTNPVTELLAVNLASYLPGDLLVKTDRMTMANSLEARCPFLDHRLLEFASQIPSSLKLKGVTTKYVLKRALEGLLPGEIIWRKKHGFGVPVGRWFRAGLKDFLCDHLLSPTALQRGYFDEQALRRLIDEHIGGRRDHGHCLWALLTLEIWHRIFIDCEVSSWLPINAKINSGFCASSAA